MLISGRNFTIVINSSIFVIGWKQYDYELGLSYQRAHRDYANANHKAQKEWVETIKKTSTTRLVMAGFPRRPSRSIATSK